MESVRLCVHAIFQTNNLGVLQAFRSGEEVCIGYKRKVADLLVLLVLVDWELAALVDVGPGHEVAKRKDVR